MGPESEWGALPSLSVRNDGDLVPVTCGALPGFNAQLRSFATRRFACIGTVVRWIWEVSVIGRCLGCRRSVRDAPHHFGTRFLDRLQVARCDKGTRGEYGRQAHLSLQRPDPIVNGPCNLYCLHLVRVSTPKSPRGTKPAGRRMVRRQHGWDTLHSRSG